MSLITRCPACQTSFRIVPDQLRISEGWVRCGQCQEVFNAALQLLQEAPHVDRNAPVVPVAVVLPPAIESSVVQPAAQLAGNHGPEPLEPFIDSVVPSEFLRAHEFELTSELARESEAPASFLRDFQNEPQPQRASMRIMLWLAVVLLLLALGLQMLVQERNRIAVMVPAVKPVLNWAGEVLGFEIAPLQQIEPIVIDSSSFSKLRADTYRLAVVMKNTAQVPLALPSIELTLTDSQDQAMMRRVFTSVEMGATTRDFAANSEWAAALTVNVRSVAGVERFTGYRVLAFYP
jgi:predicted Zn finger-like uncharacterized protein